MQEKLKNIFTAKKITPTLILAFSLIVSALALAQPVYASEELIYIGGLALAVGDEIGFSDEGEELLLTSFTRANDVNLPYDVKITVEGTGTILIGGLALAVGDEIAFAEDGGELLLTSFTRASDVNLPYDARITVDGDYRPAINGNEHFASNIDSPTPVENFIKEFKVIDDIDGDISDLIVIENDDYTGKAVLGKYPVEISATDSAGNKSTFIFYVHLSDVTAPTASADMSTKVISYDKTLDLNALKNSITYSDNYYQKSELTITLTKDTYTTNKTKIGNYVVEYTIEDPSQNKTVLSFPIEVKDLVKPVIQGMQELVKSYTSVMTTADILKGITATDAIDGNLTNKIVIDTDNYTGNANKPGTYTIIISVTDNSGNKATATITAKVIDDMPGNWYITNGVTLNLPADTPMTRAQIVDLLSKTGQVQVSPMSHVTYTTDTYSDNVGEVGIYQLAFTVKEPNGNQSNYSYVVNVMGENGDDTDVVPAAKTIVEKIKTWVWDNKVYLVVGVVSLVLIFALVGKVKEQVYTNKRKKNNKK